MNTLEMTKASLTTTLAGTWQGNGMDVFPTPQGVMRTEYFESMTFGEVFDTVNPGGPNVNQTLIGIHYYTKLSDAKTGEPMHQETGYWLFDVERGRFMKAIAIPRAITILAGGNYVLLNPGGGPAPATLWMNAAATQGDDTFGIANDTFLNTISPTTRFTTSIILSDNSLYYKEDSLLTIQNTQENHTDEATLTKVN